MGLFGKKESIEELREQVKKGNKKARQKLIHCYIDLPTDELIEIAKSDDELAQSVLWDRYYDNEEYSDALEWVLKGCERKDSSAQLILGLMYEEGQGGLKKDMSKAVELVKASAEQGNGAAYDTLESYHDKGYY